MVQKIQRIPLRKAFPHEARDFTRWLEENIDVLNDCLDITLTNAEREQSAGDFSVDIVAEDESGGKVIIENQLEKSNHDHLGKVITYLVAMEAKAAIWIVADPRPEHISAITWLNESSSADFYLLKLEAIQIADSDPAPLITLIVGPSESTKAVGKAKHEFAERYDVRKQFWTQLLELSKSKSKLHSAITPGKNAWIGAGSGKSGLSYNYVVRQHDTAVELYIDRGKGSDLENKEIFDILLKHKETIEKEFGGKLEWQRLDTKRASRIRVAFADGGWKDREKWTAVITKMVPAMIQLEKSLKPHIQKLTIQS